jgi:hypothetical protein
MQIESRKIIVIILRRLEAETNRNVDYLKSTSELRLLGNGIGLNPKKPAQQKIHSSIDRSKVIGVLYRNIDNDTKITRHDLKHTGIVIYIPSL